MTLNETVAMLAREHSESIFAWLFAGSLLEHLFPPFPGDTVTLAGAVLVAAGRLSLAATFLAVLGGSLAGSALDHAFGRWLARRMARADPASGPWARLVPSLERGREAFRRHGDLALVLNRFLPGVRALLFVAAGFSGLPLGRVLALGALSATLWNSLILAGGLLLGSHLDLLEVWVRRTGWGAWALLGLALLGALAIRVARRRPRREGPVDSGGRSSDDEALQHPEGRKTP